jgi:hypothetical protein
MSAMDNSTPRKRRAGRQTSSSDSTEDSKRVRSPFRRLMEPTRHTSFPDDAAVRFTHTQILLAFHRARYCLCSIQGELALLSQRNNRAVTVSCSIRTWQARLSEFGSIQRTDNCQDGAQAATLVSRLTLRSVMLLLQRSGCVFLPLVLLVLRLTRVSSTRG